MVLIGISLSRIPQSLAGRGVAKFVECVVLAQGTKPALEVVDQGAWCVCLRAICAISCTEMDIVVNGRSLFAFFVCEV